MPFCVIMSTQEVWEEALLIVRCILYLLVVNVGEVFSANKKSENTETLLRLLTTMDSSAANTPSLWVLFLPPHANISVRVKLFTITVYKDAYLCTNFVNLQPINTDRYRFIYWLLLKIDTNQ